MSKKIEWIIVSVVALALLSYVGLAVYRFNQPAFDDFAAYEDAFVTVRDFLLDANVARNDAAPYSVDLDEDILSVSDVEAEDESALMAAINQLAEKGFDYVKVYDDYMIFWEDETRYYGVLWSPNPKKSIKSIKEDTPSMRSHKITKEWYEVGVALDSI